jgi:hypothetical protein
LEARCPVNDHQELFQHCQLRSDATATQEIEPPAELVVKLEEQIRQFHYRNPMEICNLLNYPDEKIVASMPTDDDITEAIIEQFQPSLLPANNDDDDDSQELPVVTLGEALEMLSKLQLFWT